MTKSKILTALVLGLCLQSNSFGQSVRTNSNEIYVPKPFLKTSDPLVKKPLPKGPTEKSTLVKSLADKSTKSVNAAVKRENEATAILNMAQWYCFGFDVDPKECIDWRGNPKPNCKPFNKEACMKEHIPYVQKSLPYCQPLEDVLPNCEIIKDRTAREKCKEKRYAQYKTTFVPCMNKRVHDLEAIGPAGNASPTQNAIQPADLDNNSAKP